MKLSFSLCSSAVAAAVAASPAAATDVALCTDLGRVTVELDEEKAPLHAANFLEYVDQGFYAGTVFHRVVEGFAVQGGGYDGELREKPTLAPVRNESQNGLRNVRGTIAAARTSDPDSATSQFYFNVADNASLDATPRNAGYTVFGRVTDGMDVVDAIAALPTGAAGPFGGEVPDPLVAITSAARLDREALEAFPAEGRIEAMRDNLAAAFEAGRYVEALDWITHLRASCAPLDAELLLTEAKVAAGLLRAPRARAALRQYFAVAEREDPGYAEAAELGETLAD